MKIVDFIYGLTVLAMIKRIVYIIIFMLRRRQKRDVFYNEFHSKHCGGLSRKSTKYSHVDTYIMASSLILW